MGAITNKRSPSQQKKTKLGSDRDITGNPQASDGEYADMTGGQITPKEASDGKMNRSLSREEILQERRNRRKGRTSILPNFDVKDIDKQRAAAANMNKPFRRRRSGV